jgi:hypothetical protein
LLVSEGLSRAIVTARDRGYFQGISISPNKRVTHLLFVDDVLIFYSGLRRDVEKLAIILDLFGKAMSMQINSRKSTLSTHNMEREEVEHYMDIFSFEQRELDEGLNYLGFHLKPNNYRKVDWLWLLEKLEKRLKGWIFRLAITSW